MKGIPTSLSPHLMSVLMSMGHGDEIVLADGNFPAASLGREFIVCNGSDLLELLDAVLRFLPLDTGMSSCVFLMAATEDCQPRALWQSYQRIICHHEPVFSSCTVLEKPDFYARAKAAYAIVSTGETTRYANLILRKGVVNPDQLPARYNG